MFHKCNTQVFIKILISNYSNSGEFKEDTVREELINPLLKQLGYRLMDISVFIIVKHLNIRL